MLRDHYCTEDDDMMIIELNNLHTTFVQVIRSAETTHFIDKDRQLPSINSSLKKLMALIAKKLESERPVNPFRNVRMYK